MTSSVDRVERFLLYAVAYLGLSALWIYEVLDQGRLEGSEARAWSVLAVVGAAHVAFGFAVRDWPALLLPVVVLFLAFPAGYPESRFEPGPVWHGQLVLLPVEEVLIAAGLGLRAFVERRRTAAARSS
ncbi:MAG TPA: hypothetical protein VD769_02060 [Gaiellaceae bacterium]|nr:hypothetical protein [Gaiellaceae bacterium]